MTKIFAGVPRKTSQKIFCFLPDNLHKIKLLYVCMINTFRLAFVISFSYMQMRESGRPFVRYTLMLCEVKILVTWR